MDDELDTVEREALDTWTVPQSPDVVDAVMARHAAAARPSRRPMWVGVAVCALAVGSILALRAVRAPPLAGSAKPNARTTLEVGRGILVMESGAAIDYATKAGATRVEQHEGNVFYRVNPGRTPFVVETPQGTVTVLGTCFRVEVQQMKKGLIGAVSGSAITTLVLVSVYEGKVVTASPAGSTTLVAGEAAEVREGTAPKKRAMAMTSVTTARDERGLGSVAGQVVETQRVVDTAQNRASLLAEKASLEAEVRRLEDALERVEEKKKNVEKTYDLDQATLEGMASNCELRWDATGLGPEPSRLSQQQLDELGISQSEKEVIDRKVSESHRGVIDAVRRAYTEITGDENTGSLAASSMFAEVKDKVQPQELKQVFQKLARERAGLEAPADPNTWSPLERMYRAMTSQGDRLEASLAAELGAEDAKRLRDFRGGWGGTHRSSYGCPK